MQKFKSNIITNEFSDILTIIECSKERAYIAVNKELIEMYFQIGKYISEKINSGRWGICLFTYIITQIAGNIKR